MNAKEKSRNQHEPYALEKDAMLYQRVRDAINKEKDAGFTVTAMQEINPQIAAFMKENNIVKLKAKMDGIEKQELSLDTLKKLVDVADQIKKANP